MHILDLDLHIVDDCCSQSSSERLLLLLLLSRHALGVPLFQQLGAVQLLHFDSVCSLLLFLRIVLLILFRGGKEEDIFDVDANRGTSQI